MAVYTKTSVLIVFTLLQDSETVNSLKFTQEPRNITVEQGDTAEFSCSFNLPPKECIWRQNNNSIDGDSLDYEQVVDEQTCHLIMHSASLRHAGSYECIVPSTHSNGKRELGLKSRKGYFSVKPPEQALVTGPQNQHVYLGQTSDLKCTFKLPVNHCTWFNNDIEVHPKFRKFRIRTNHTECILSVYNTEVKDKGPWKCQMTGTSLVSSNAYLTLKDKFGHTDLSSTTEETMFPDETIFTTNGQSLSLDELDFAPDGKMVTPEEPSSPSEEDEGEPNYHDTCSVTKVLIGIGTCFFGGIFLVFLVIWIKSKRSPKPATSQTSFPRLLMEEA